MTKLIIISNMVILNCLTENANIVQLICSLCMLLVTVVYVILTWRQAKYTKQTFLESVKQTKEERQPYIIPTINEVTGVAFDTSKAMRVQLSFHCKLENVGDSSAVSVYTMLYAKMKYQPEKKMVYAHLIPKYNYAIGISKIEEENIHFETSQFRDIVEDLEISYAKNMKRIEINPYQKSYKGPSIILRVLYQNMMGQWFESMLEQELLELRMKEKDEDKWGDYVKNENIADGDIYEGCMINPCYSLLTRKMVSVEYVNKVLKDCGDNAETGYSLPVIN